MSDDETEDRAGEQDDQNDEENTFSYEYPDDLLSGGRERGLTKNDRRFLVTGKNRHGEEPSDKSRVNIRTRIRKRIRETIVDFWLTMQYLDTHDRELVFEPRSPPEDWEMREGIKNTIQFFYRGLEDSDLMDFETALTSAVHDAEHDRHRGPVLVETEFEVDVDEQFRVQEAYDKFQKGAPLEPMEVGALLITGRVNEPEEVQRLAQHARGHGLIEGSVSPLSAREMADLLGGEATERMYSTVAHLHGVETTLDAGRATPRPAVRGEDLLHWDLPSLREQRSYSTREDLPNADIDDGGEVLDEDGDGAPEQAGTESDDAEPDRDGADSDAASNGEE